MNLFIKITNLGIKMANARRNIVWSVFVYDSNSNGVSSTQHQLNETI